MKRLAIGVALMLVAALALPAMAAGEERHSYITVKDITVRLEGADAAVTMNYAIDEGIGFLVLLLGKSDLKQKTLDILNFNNATVQYLDLERIEVRVKDVSTDYGQGTYWFPAHGFGVVVPSLTIITARDIKHYENVSEFPDGFGYFV